MHVLRTRIGYQAEGLSRSHSRGNMLKCQIFNLESRAYEDIGSFVPNPAEARFTLVVGPKGRDRDAIALLLSKASGIGYNWKYGNSEYFKQVKGNATSAGFKSSVSIVGSRKLSVNLGVPPREHYFLSEIGENEHGPMTQHELSAQLTFLYQHLFNGGRVVAHMRGGAARFARFKELFEFAKIEAFTYDQLMELLDWVGYRLINIEHGHAPVADREFSGARVVDHVAEGLPLFAAN